MSESPDDWIRRAAGRNPKPEREPRQHPVDEWIRASTGRGRPAPVEPEPAAGNEQDEQSLGGEALEREAIRAALRAGFAPERIEWATKRLHSRTAGELANEARELAAAAEKIGALDAPEPTAPRVPDGGARPIGPKPPPSVDSILRAKRDQQRREVWDEARGLDASKPQDHDNGGLR
jgi:hypothetical protein